MEQVNKKEGGGKGEGEWEGKEEWEGEWEGEREWEGKAPVGAWILFHWDGFMMLYMML